MPNTMKQAITDAIAEMSTDVVLQLSVEQQAALEAKFNALPEEVRSNTNAKYPQLSVTARYIVRQMVKEANGKLASQMRPKWYSNLELNAASLKSAEPAIKDYATKQLASLADEFDSKESASLLKKYKSTKDLTSKDAHIIELCGIFGISPSTIA